MSENATAQQDTTMPAVRRVEVLFALMSAPGMGHMYADVHDCTADDLDTITTAYPDATTRDHPNGSIDPFRAVQIPTGNGTITAYGPLRPTAAPTTFGDYLAENAASFSEVTR